MKGAGWKSGGSLNSLGFFLQNHSLSLFDTV